jgi:hypothetical protein
LETTDHDKLFLIPLGSIRGVELSTSDVYQKFGVSHIYSMKVKDVYTLGWLAFTSGFAHIMTRPQIWGGLSKLIWGVFLGGNYITVPTNLSVLLHSCSLFKLNHTYGRTDLSRSILIVRLRHTVQKAIFPEPYRDELERMTHRSFHDANRSPAVFFC